MSTYLTSYIDKAKKFDVVIQPGKNEGNLKLVIATYDNIAIEMSMEQILKLQDVLNQHLGAPANATEPADEPDELG